MLQEKKPQVILIRNREIFHTTPTQKDETLIVRSYRQLISMKAGLTLSATLPTPKNTSPRRSAAGAVILVSTLNALYA
jgi:hypothetical protein